MCGIAGIYGYGGDAAERAELLRVRNAMVARGPDGEGLWLGENDRIGLAHRRLSIIDLSDAGAQPMRDETTGNVIVFNGEIYNYRSLRRELEREGRMFRSESDTEVLLHLFAAQGPEMLGRLRGMYAFAIWEHGTRSLFLARDPFGIKPLYYADDGRTFRFASQVKALLKANVDRTPEPAGHAGFFVWGSVPEPFTLYKGIHAMPAAHWMRVSPDGASRPVDHGSIRRVLAAAAAEASRANPNDAVTSAAAAVRDSVAAHFVADVPVSVFLSSGLDSGMIAGCGPSPDLRTVTLGFEEYAGSNDDEVPLAEAVAKQLRTRHTTVMVKRADFEVERERLLAAMDQPSIDGINTWFVARAAASQGLKVALSGLGGDELFGSYPSFRDVPRIARWSSPLAAVPGLGPAVRMVSAPLLAHVASPKYAGMLEYGGSLGGAYLLRRALFMPWELAEVIGPELAATGWARLQARAALEETTSGLANDRLAVSALEMSWYMRNQLLRDADWAGMAHSLEIRVPFVDVALLRRIALAGSTAMSKRAVAAAVAPELPPAVLSRAKTGFSVPVRDWLLANGSPRERGLRGWARHVYASGGWSP
jgi:asparagine synthase (glutamine-hydrolysing)